MSGPGLCGRFSCTVMRAHRVSARNTPECRTRGPYLLLRPLVGLIDKLEMQRLLVALRMPPVGVRGGCRAMCASTARGRHLFVSMLSLGCRLKLANELGRHLQVLRPPTHARARISSRAARSCAGASARLVVLGVIILFLLRRA
jgi:hypothetical protein